MSYLPVHFGKFAASCLALLLAVGTFVPALGAEPGRGLTGPFEIDFLKTIIDHHYAALRITELAAGTDPTRDPNISPTEGTSPTPSFAETAAKATLDEVKSLARRNNRMQREEILTAQNFLRQWYGVNHQPRITPESQRQINLLEQAKAGPDFDHLFLEVFSRHHYVATRESLDCLVSSDIKHVDLERYCRNIVESQVSDIDEMRHLLCEKYSICDYQPLVGLKGRHSGDEGQQQD